MIGIENRAACANLRRSASASGGSLFLVANVREIFAIHSSALIVVYPPQESQGKEVT
jgi:hypothetical protein